MPTYNIRDEELIDILPNEATEIISKKLLKNGKIAIYWR